MFGFEICLQGRKAFERKAFMNKLDDIPTNLPYKNPLASRQIHTVPVAESQSTQVATYNTISQSNSNQVAESRLV